MISNLTITVFEPLHSIMVWNKKKIIFHVRNGYKLFMGQSFGWFKQVVIECLTDDNVKSKDIFQLL